MTDVCSKCGREKWQSTGGMGGGLMPDDLAICTGGQTCRIFGEGFKRGAAWMLETAKREAAATDPGGMPVDIRWTDVDAVLEARGK